MIASLIVVFYHVEITFEKYFGAGVSSWFKPGSCGVQIFFVISGFVMFHVHSTDPASSLATIRRFARKRFQRIYPPLWIVLIALVPVVYPAKASILDVISAFLVLPVNTEPYYSEVVLAVEWTLRHEMLFYAFFALAMFNRRFGVPLLIAWSGIGSILGLFLSSSTWLYFLFNPNHMLFLAGMVVAYRVKAARSNHYAIALSLVGGFVFGVCWVVMSFQGIDVRMEILGFGLSFAVLLYGLIMVGYLDETNMILKLLAASSYATYLVHFPLISVLCKLFTEVGLYQTMSMRILYATITVVGCLASGVVFHLFIEKPMINFFRRPEKASVSS